MLLLIIIHINYDEHNIIFLLFECFNIVFNRYPDWVCALYVFEYDLTG